MKKGIIGKKLGMTQIFDAKGNVIPVTLIEAGPCAVAQKKTVENDGYGYYVTFGIKDLGHTQLSADDGFFHFFLHSYWLTVLILPLGIRQRDF